MDVSRRVVAGAVLALCSAACGDARPSGLHMSSGGQGIAIAGAAGHAGETAGAGVGGDASGGGGGSMPVAGAAVGGSAGVDAGGNGGSSGSGSTAGGPVGGAPVGGGPPACNSLELLEVGSVCSTTVSGLAPQGGALVDGLYALVEYELTACSFHLEQTLRLQMTEQNTYHVDTVVNVDDFHSSGTFVTEGVMLHSTLDCGATEVNKAYGYSFSEVDGERYFTLFRAGVYTYRRVGD